MFDDAAEYGFVRFGGSTYIAAVSGVSGDPNELGVTDAAYEQVAGNRPDIDRALVKAEGDNIGFSGGHIAELNPSTDIPYGVTIPANRRLMRYDADPRENPEAVPQTIRVTFFDEDHPDVSYRALGYQPVATGQGVEIYRDVLEE